VPAVRPKDIRPTGVLVPLLVGLDQVMKRLVPIRRTGSTAGGRGWSGDGAAPPSPAQPGRPGR
jgi:hypothetical protein